MDILKALLENAEESPIFRGVNEDGTLTVVTAGPEATWTLLLVTPAKDGKGIACVLAMGNGWQLSKPARKELGS